MSYSSTYTEKINSITIIAPPGAGKGTQFKLLDKNKFYHISTGDMLREMRSVNKEVDELMKTPYLLDDKKIITIAGSYIDSKIEDRTFDPYNQILAWDGAPRTKVQVELMKERYDMVRVLHLMVDDDISDWRMDKRAREEKRTDSDTKEKRKLRLDIYKKDTFPIISEGLYNQNIVFNIDGRKSVEEVQKCIRRALEDLIDPN